LLLLPIAAAATTTTTDTSPYLFTAVFCYLMESKKYYYLIAIDGDRWERKDFLIS
jgi:hypothetical protein